MFYTHLLVVGLYLLCIFLFGFVRKRVSASFKEYILANRSVHEIITGISHVSSEISVGTFTVVASMIYTTGFSRLWVDLGFFVFSILSWRLLAGRLRVQSEESKDALTIPQYLANKFDSKTVGIFASLIITLFTTTYIGANMLGLTKVLSKVVSLESNLVAVAVLIVTLLYTTVGGFRSASHVNVLQGAIMLLATCILPLSLLIKFGLEPLTTFLKQSGSSAVGHLDITQAVFYFSFASVMFGTPHTIGKFLAIKSPDKLNTARNTSIIINIIIYLGIAISAVYGRKLLPSMKDTEMLLLNLSEMFTSPLYGSMIIIAILAAVMSTIDAQLISSASCIANDIYRHITSNRNDIHLIFATKLMIIFVGALALSISLIFNQSVGKLAIFSLTGLGASIGPVILFSLYTKTRNKIPALLGLTSGTTATILLTIFNTSDIHYNMLPALCITAVVMLASSCITGRTVKCVESNN
ncbi:sodium:solute symporter family transporter [Neorickettsia sennetsu]|uniref:Sodium:proline symporter n=1 Tax=Ehrlichia sennetsu (strain ATCC VR-367 / Miyayama) TaxID=222891 RepID=Q2GD46_EHRS3|nr:sodium:proline symporter [Neorickettsia sennetsu]ABD46006.1 putative sodium:proline symporter [Neorickettsia sennetsu str. Miyayama]